MSVKINRFEIENVKRVKAVAYSPDENGLTVIGGRNGQGKTSVLDAIAWALGGEKYRPTEAKYSGSVVPPEIRITLNNGVVVERRGKNSALTVTDPYGRKAGQQLLNSFIEALALDLPKFLEATGKEKAATLLRILGIEDKLLALDEKENRLYSERLMVGRIADSKMKHAEEMPEYPEAPTEYLDVSELIQRQQSILAQNGENARKRLRRQEIAREFTAKTEQYERLMAQMDELRKTLDKLAGDVEAADKDIEALIDESTSEIEEEILNFSETNRKVRANRERKQAEEEAEKHVAEYNALSAEIDHVRMERMNLLNNADLPLPGLTVEEGELKYNGAKWDCMSASEQLRVGTAIVRRLKPECGFVLMDKLEQMDAVTMKEFGEWLESEGLQVIATRVTSDGSECSIVIEDGRAFEKKETQTTSWKAGEF